MLGSDSITCGSRAFNRVLRAIIATLAIAALPWAASAQDIEEIIVPATSAERVMVLVELNGSAAAQVYGLTFETKAPIGRIAATAAAVSAARAQISANEREHDAFVSRLIASGVPVEPMYRVTKALNGLAYMVDRNAISVLQALPNVKAVHIIEPEFPSLSTSVPFLGTPTAWSGASPLGVTGQGIRIGIIDTGVDYQHATFGGTGLLADYQANNRAIITDGFFPNARVIGGTDFAGDAYNGNNAAVPDPDPMDCNGHGTHVASTAAGGGVKADGAPFTGPYNTATPFSTLRLGPGVAPQASVYALRVFGCTGSTGLTVLAIDWSLDPNGDGDLSDHLDVINMSLGSNFGSLSNTSSMAADNASRMGVVVVASAGNAGDTYTIGGAPAAGRRVISTAATGDNGLPGVFITVTSPASVAGNYVAGASSMADASNVPTAAAAGQTGALLLAIDGTAPVNDGCTALTVTNAAAMVGKVALIDRGTCGFAVKYQFARAAGAIGVIIVTNNAAPPSGMTGTVVGPVDIPAAMISLDAGNALKARLAALETVTVVFNAATQADMLASFSSRGPRGGLNGVKPDLAAPGLAITAAQTGVTCPSGACIVPNASGFLPGSQSLILQGTSMAAPHAAGVMALLVQRFPDRSTEELKAMAMNTSLNDVYQFAGNINRIGVDRSGAGRIDPVKALRATVAAFNADEAGAVNLAFFGEVVGTQTQSKRIRVVNYGTTAQTFALGFDIANDAPGIAFSLPGGNSITIPAGGTAFVNVQVDGTASLMNHVRDVSADPGQSVTAPAGLAALAAMPRHYLTNKSGYLNFVQSSATVIRVPIYAALRPASNMATPAVIATAAAPTGTTSLALSGTQVCTGTIAAGPACTGTFPVTDVSRVSAFELQVNNPRNATLPSHMNIRHVGTAYDAASGLILFGVSTWGDWGSPTDVSFNIHVDNNSNGSFDSILFHSNSGTLSNLFVTPAVSAQDVFVNGVFTPPNSVSTGGPGSYVNRLSASQANAALFGNNVIVLAATPAQLGLAAGVTNFRYKVQTCFGFNPICGRFATPSWIEEVAGPFAWNYAAAAQGLNFSGTHMAQDLNGATIPVAWNTANMATNGSLGALVLHHHNASGKRAQVVTLEGTASADLGVMQTLTPAAPTQGQNVTIALTASNNGPNNATGVVVSNLLPAGMAYVSDNGAGAYVPATGAWTIGNLSAAGSSSLSIVATVTGSGAITVRSQISSTGVSDTNPANDAATSNINVAAQSTLAVTNVRTTASPVLVNGTSGFTVTVRNSGIDTLFNVAVALNRSPAAAISASNPSSGSVNNATGVWSIPSLAGGAAVTLTLSLTAPANSGTLTLTAVTTADNAVTTLQAASVTVISPAAVTTTKTVSGTTFAVGSTVTYTVTLANSSSTQQQDNPGNEFVDVLPASLTLVSANASSGTAVATLANNTVAWNGAIAANSSITITITATVKAGTEGATISNQGTANFDADGNGTNESSVATDDPAVNGRADPTPFVVRFARVTASKTGSAPNPSVGGSVVYTITLNNTGNAAAPDSAGNEVTDVLPATLTLVSASATSGTAVATIVGNTVTWNGSVAASGNVVITINALINQFAPGSIIVNNATVAFDGDLNGSNESTLASGAAIFSVAALPVHTLSDAVIALLALLLLLAGGYRLHGRRPA